MLASKIGRSLLNGKALFNNSYSITSYTALTSTTECECGRECDNARAKGECRDQRHCEISTSNLSSFVIVWVESSFFVDIIIQTQRDILNNNYVHNLFFLELKINGLVRIYVGTTYGTYRLQEYVCRKKYLLVY